MLLFSHPPQRVPTLFPSFFFVPPPYNQPHFLLLCIEYNLKKREKKETRNYESHAPKAFSHAPCSNTSIFENIALRRTTICTFWCTNTHVTERIFIYNKRDYKWLRFTQAKLINIRKREIERDNIRYIKRRHKARNGVETIDDLCLFIFLLQ